MNPTQEKRKLPSGLVETTDETYNRAQNKLRELGAVSAADLVNPVTPVTVPEPKVASLPSSRLVDNITRDTQGFISAQTEEAKQLRDLQSTYGALANKGSLSDLFTETQASYGVTPESFKELKNIQLQLAGRGEESAITKSRIGAAAGQTAAQAQREVTQEDREEAIRSAGLAARAAVIQGNIETANAAAQQAVNFAFQDRQLNAQNLLNQIEMVQGQVDEQTAQLLEQEKRGYEAELANIEDLKTSISEAIASGGASQADIRTLTSDTVDDATKRELAAQIVGKVARQELAPVRGVGGSVGGVGTVTGDSSALGLTGTTDDPMIDLLLSSAGGRTLTQSEAEPLTNSVRVLDGLGDLQAVISASNTDPILGLFKKVNPYNLEARTIDTAINTLVPQLARGTYGEVGVLTDADMARYADTLPNLTSTADQNKAVLALTLRKVRTGFSAQLEGMKAAGRDVSGYVDIYRRFSQQINDLESQIGIGQVDDTNLDAEFERLTQSKQTPTSYQNEPLNQFTPGGVSGGLFKSIGNFFFGS